MTVTATDRRSRQTPVRDQGDRPSCVGFAVSAAHEWTAADDVVRSPEDALWAGRQEGGVAHQEATSVQLAVAGLSRLGHAFERAWPYGRPPFGRMVAYPRADGEDADQLADTVRKLRQELATPGPKSSRYEINIYSERLDRNPMSFPCLAHVSLHLHQERLHMQAVYRNEVLVGRAYGNYLGLAQLQEYMARACGLDLGELLLTVNHAEIDGPVGAVARMLDGLAS